MADAMKPLANDVQTAVIPGAGHWAAEEAPNQVLAALTVFLAPYRDAALTVFLAPYREAAVLVKPEAGVAG